MLLNRAWSKHLKVDTNRERPDRSRLPRLVISELLSAERINRKVAMQMLVPVEFRRRDRGLDVLERLHAPASHDLLHLVSMRFQRGPTPPLYLAHPEPSRLPMLLGQDGRSAQTVDLTHPSQPAELILAVMALRAGEQELGNPHQDPRWPNRSQRSPRPSVDETGCGVARRGVRGDAPNRPYATTATPPPGRRGSGDPSCSR
jgi:hypothetical protein